MIDRSTIDKIIDAANIVDVVSDFVTLKRAGANYKGLCPFHDDRTPSFMVSPAKNYCKCFACGKGGNPVGFIMEHEQMTYPDALRWLAKKYGITIEEREQTAEEKANQSERESLFIANEWANKWFQEQMYDTIDGRAIGLAYFRSRGFRDDIIRKFQLGYCPSGRDKCIQAALKAGYKEQYLTSTPDEQGIAHGVGIAIKHDDGKIFDRFSGRVMFPIFTVSGKVVGFGGRVLDAATKGVSVKYQNSPESIIYHKKNELYGLFQAKQAIVKQDCCYMVEGYTDVMAMHQNGVENVVASSGTALTHEQIRLLHRFTSNIVVLYDGDAAGIKASQRGIDMLLREGMNVKLMLLPDGKDPDEFGREHTAQEFQEYMANNQIDFIKFKTNLLMKESQGDPIKQSRLVNNIVQSIAVIPDEIARLFYIRETAQMMQISEALITSAVSKQIKLNVEEWKKEREREQRRGSTLPTQQAGNANPANTTPGNTTQPPVSQGNYSRPEDEIIPPDDLLYADYEDFHTTPSPGNTIPSSSSTAPNQAGTASSQPASTNNRHASAMHEKEMLITQMVIRHGEIPICNVADENGNERPFTVVEYIHYALNEDDLHIQDPLYQRILDEAQQQVHAPNFVAERHFLNHTDPQISSLAFELATDKEELSKIHQQKVRQSQQDVINQLMDKVNHLIVDLKLSIVQQQRVQIMQQMRDPAILQDKERCRQILAEFQRIKEVENGLAKACGDRVIT